MSFCFYKDIYLNCNFKLLLLIKKHSINYCFPEYINRFFMIGHDKLFIYLISTLQITLKFYYLVYNFYLKFENLPAQICGEHVNWLLLWLSRREKFTSGAIYFTTRSIIKTCFRVMIPTPNLENNRSNWFFSWSYFYNL